MAQPATRVDVEVAGRTLSLSNLDKVLYPVTGTTKGQVIDHYARVAPVLLPHLRGRPVTLLRFPNGVDAPSFFEKNAPSHRPEWLRTAEVWSNSGAKSIQFCLLEEPAALVWTANLAAIELHPSLARHPALAEPTMVVFDLDPGPPADVLTCARVALWLREALDRLGLAVWVKTSGSKGLQAYVPLNTPTDYERTKPFALAIGELLARVHPELVLTEMTKASRTAKVFVDWSQNSLTKTTVSVYSLRARERPWVSTPLTWGEVEAAVEAQDAGLLRFEASDVHERIDRLGDLFAPLLTTEQTLPAFA